MLGAGTKGSEGTGAGAPKAGGFSLAPWADKSQPKPR